MLLLVNAMDVSTSHICLFGVSHHICLFKLPHHHICLFGVRQRETHCVMSVPSSHSTTCDHHPTAAAASLNNIIFAWEKSSGFKWLNSCGQSQPLLRPIWEDYTIPLGHRFIRWRIFIRIFRNILLQNGSVVIVNILEWVYDLMIIGSKSFYKVFCGVETWETEVAQYW